MLLAHAHRRMAQALSTARRTAAVAAVAASPRRLAAPRRLDAASRRLDADRACDASRRRRPSGGATGGAGWVATVDGRGCAGGGSTDGAGWLAAGLEGLGLAGAAVRRAGLAAPQCRQPRTTRRRAVVVAAALYLYTFQL